jgi:hypothetical protein
VHGKGTYPLTMGQLSMWRDLRVRPRRRLWESNLDPVWAVPPGVTTDQVRRAFVELAVRHESLRTVYRPADDPHHVRQVVLPDPGVLFAEAPVREAFDLTERPPWRAWVRADGGAPRVHLVIHHIAADGVALQILESDFQSLLRGDRLAPAPTPGELAARQRSDRLRARLTAAAGYVTRTVGTAPPAVPVARGPLVRARAHTGIPYSVARWTARKLQVTLPNLLLSAYAQALAATTGTPRHLLWLLTGNRLDPAVRRLVSSLTQWVPLAVECPPGTPVAVAAADVNVTALTAAQYGVYDPFAVPPLDFDRGAFFTYLPPPLTATTEESTEESTVEKAWVEWLPPRGYSGASFYLIASVFPSVRLTLRVQRGGYGRPEADHFLGTMTRLLRQAAREYTVVEPA